MTDTEDLLQENLRLRARVKELEFEVGALNAQRDATRAWLGEPVVARSPLAETGGAPLTVEDKARLLVQEFPEHKIQAIKALRTWSTETAQMVAGIPYLGLKEAKDAIDGAYAAIGRSPTFNPMPPRPGSGYQP